MAEKVILKQFKNKTKQPVAGLTPEHAIYDKNGVRLDAKLGNVNLQEFRDLQQQCVNNIKQQQNASETYINNKVVSAKAEIDAKHEEVAQLTQASMIGSGAEGLEGNNVQDNLNSAGEKLSELNYQITGYIEKHIDIIFKTGFYYSQDTNQRPIVTLVKTEDQSSVYTDAIDITPFRGGIIHISMSNAVSNSSMGTILTKDDGTTLPVKDNGSTVGYSYFQESNYTLENEKYIKEIVVPTDASYLYLSYKGTREVNVVAYKQDEGLEYKVDNIKQDVYNLSDKINNCDNEIDNINLKINGNKPIVIPFVAHCEVDSDGRINSTTLVEGKVGDTILLQSNIYDEPIANQIINVFAIYLSSGQTKLGTMQLDGNISKFVATEDYTGILLYKVNLTASSTADVEITLSRGEKINGINDKIDDINNNIGVKTFQAKTTDDKKIKTHLAKIISCGKTDCFLFFTDPHITGNNEGVDVNNIKSFIEKIYKVYNSTPCNFICCGGDWLNVDSSKEDVAFKLGLTTGIMQSSFLEYCPVEGNHDYGIDTNNGSTVKLNKDNVNTLMFGRQMCQPYYVKRYGNADYYFLNTNYSSERVAQFDWLANQLIERNAENVVIIQHITYALISGQYVKYPPFVTDEELFIEAYNNHSSLTYQKKTYDFSNCIGRIHFVMSGHIHQDRLYTIGGVPCITTITANTEGDKANFDLCLADYGNHKLYLTRFGQGVDRVIDL